MPFMPFNILGIWLRGLLSIAILAGGIYLLKGWYDESTAIELAVPKGDHDPLTPEQRQERLLEAVRSGAGQRVFRFEPGWNEPTALLAGAIALLAWATVGRLIGHGLSTILMKKGSDVPGSADEDPRPERTGEVHEIRRPDGSVLRVECYGPADAPPIVFTHGWGANSTQWFYSKRHLADRFRLILWDEPGLGLSKKPDNNDYRLENLAADLDAVLTFAGDRPAVLVGHSIGGMITLTFCKIFPGALGSRVSGLVLAHTSYTNPVRTTHMAALYTAIEKPVLIPLMRLTIALWPLVWVMDWLSYLNGSMHRDTHRSSFSGHETKGQLDLVAGYMPRDRPDVLARGMLGMIGYDATEALGRIDVPTLVCVGDQDTTTRPEAGEFIARSVQKGDLVTLSPAKHMGLLEHHARFDRLVGEFAAACQPAGAVG